MNKFEQVSSDDHQMPLTGGHGWAGSRSDVFGGGEVGLGVPVLMSWVGGGGGLRLGVVQ